MVISMLYTPTIHPPHSLHTLKPRSSTPSKFKPSLLWKLATAYNSEDTIMIHRRSQETLPLTQHTHTLTLSESSESKSESSSSPSSSSSSSSSYSLVIFTEPKSKVPRLLPPLPSNRSLLGFASLLAAAAELMSGEASPPSYSNTTHIHNTHGECFTQTNSSITDPPPPFTAPNEDGAFFSKGSPPTPNAGSGLCLSLPGNSNGARRLGMAGGT